MSIYRAPRFVRGVQYAAALLAVLFGAVGFLGSLVGLRQLAGAIGRYDAMVPMAALSFVALGVALIVRIARPVRQVPVRAICAGIMVVAILEVTDYFTGLTVAPDRLFASIAEMSSGRQPGRMSAIVAAGLAMIAVSLLLSHAARGSVRAASQWIALVVANVGFALSVGYAYDTPILFSVGPLAPALPSAVCLALLGVAGAALTFDRQPLSLFDGDSVRAQMLRGVLPAVLVAIVAFASVDIVFHRLGMHQSALSAAVMFIFSVAIVSYAMLRISGRIGGRIDRADSERTRALDALEIGNMKLSEMVRDVAVSMGRAVEARDPYTQGHEQRVALLARQIATEMGLSDVEISGIEMAALLHDVGKLCVPADILSKPGKLSDVEFALVREHSRQGYEILKDIDFPWDIAHAVLQHHERVDGSGYPHGLTGDQINPLARVLAVADVVEAMASHRPYRPSLGASAAIAELREHPERYDREAAGACERLYERGVLAIE